jgi:hypothetical protein
MLTIKIEKGGKSGSCSADQLPAMEQAGWKRIVVSTSAPAATEKPAKGESESVAEVEVAKSAPEAPKRRKSK